MQPDLEDGWINRNWQNPADAGGLQDHLGKQVHNYESKQASRNKNFLVLGAEKGSLVFLFFRLPGY